MSVVIYAQIGVLEYFLFDPTCDYLDPPLQGNRLTEGVYHRIEADKEGGLLSEVLGLRLVIQNDELEFMHPKTGERLLTASERLQEAASRHKAEEEIARLREQLRKYEERQ